MIIIGKSKKVSNKEFTPNKILNKGYSETGASTNKKSLKGYVSKTGNAQEDIDDNLQTLIGRSRNLYMGSPLATSAIKTSRTNIVGSGLKLRAVPDYKYLGLTENEAKAWKEDVEREFSLWAESKFCDATRVNDFYGMQQLQLVSWLLNGEGIAIIKRGKPNNRNPYSLQLHLIEADRISTPQDMATFGSTTGKSKNGNKIYSGVEIDETGAVVAYHVCNQYPNSDDLDTQPEWIRIEAYGQTTGEPNILQIFESERCEQYRGVPYLAPVIESLKQLTRYTEAELMAAVVQASLTAFITSTNEKGNDISGEHGFDNEFMDETINQEDLIDKGNEKTYELGAGTINKLETGEDVKFIDPSRPNSGFGDFLTSMSKQIGASLEIPHEVLLKSFMSSYSASRAALLEAWKAFKMRRAWFANGFCKPCYELFLSEAVDIGRVKAHGYFTDPAKRKAWSKSEWIGPAPGQIDPVREVTAAKLRNDYGFTTKERETIELTGGNFEDNVSQIKRENALLKDAGNIENNNMDNIVNKIIERGVLDDID